jgi:L-2-hydroxyglutarate oxidase
VEPNVVGLRALHVPATGIIDWGRFARVLADAVRARGARIVNQAEVRAIRRLPEGLVLETTAGAFGTRDLITAAGVNADRLAGMDPDEPEVPVASAGKVRIIPFRGDYAILRPEARHFCRALIYPVPDPRFPFLGVHLTRRIDGEVWAGPNAVLALGREAYRRRDVDARELIGILGFRGFQRLAVRYWRTGAAEMIRDWSLRLFVRELQRYTPEVSRRDVAWGPAGIRAQGVLRDGSLAEDFMFAGGAHTLHVLNAPSPAATASLAIGRELAGIAIGRFAL